LAYSGCDHFTPEQLRAAKATGWALMEREELFQNGVGGPRRGLKPVKASNEGKAA
jgi:hypothetical protein